MYRKITTIAFSLPLFASTAMAQGPSASPGANVSPPAQLTALQKENSVNVSPLGLLSGSYGVNYERLFSGYHGLLAELNFSHSSDDDASASGYGGTVGYRFHWSGNQNSGFVGLNLGYQTGNAEAKIVSGNMTKSFDLDTTVSSVTVNLGKRWAWDSGLNVTFRLGAGKGNYDVATDSTDPDAQEAVEFVDDLLAFLPVAFDGELSVGYIF